MAERAVFARALEQGECALAADCFPGSCCSDDTSTCVGKASHGAAGRPQKPA